MSKHIVKCFFALLVVTLITSCKLAIITPTGGDVTSQSGTRNCSQGKYCEFAVTDTEFSEVFTATAKPGYEFVRWNNGDGFWCADSTSPTCEIPMPDDRTYAELVIAVYATSYAMPIFRDVGFDTDGDGQRNELDEDDDNDGLLDVDDPCPINPEQACGGDIIFANGKEWFQPDLFTGLDWNTINSVCPAGICDGILNGYNMSGWIWANNADVLSLFGYYGPAGGGSFDNCPFVDSFFAQGWRKTNSVYPITPLNALLVGQTSTGSRNVGAIINTEQYPCNYFAFSISMGPGNYSPTGAWFYRAP